MPSANWKVNARATGARWLFGVEVHQLVRALEKVNLFRKMPRQCPVQAPCTPIAVLAAQRKAATKAPETPRTPPRTRKKGKQSDDCEQRTTPVKRSKADQDLWKAETPVTSPWTPWSSGAKTPMNGTKTPWTGDVLVAATPQTPRAAPRSVKGAAPRSPGPSQSHAQRFQGLKRMTTSDRVLAFESMALQTMQHSSLMDAGVLEMLVKPSLQEALINEDLELTVATLSLLLELPVTPLNVVGFQRLFKRLREQMPVVRFLLRAITANAGERNVEHRADDIEDFFDMTAPRPDTGTRGTKVRTGTASSKLLKRRRVLKN